ncbi:cysteine hydrolase family protein [Clostridia bacterium]|nr:cysteine hydrolase family protein [Clostridia bacterium]
MRVNDRHVSFYYQDDKEYGEINIEPHKTALLIIDMQNFFAKRTPSEQLDAAALKEQTRWEPFYQTVDDVVIPNNQRILTHFRKMNMEVIFARITCLKESGRDRSLVQKESGFNNLYLPIGDKQGEIIDELTPQKDEIVVMKTTDSALTGTNLRLILRNMEIDTVIVTGLFTDQCVSCSVRSLADESFRVYLVEDACMAATQEIQNHELEILNNIYCHVINTEELFEALEKAN